MSVASHPNELLKIEKQGCIRKFSVRMMRLGLKLLVGCFMSSRMIPKAMSYILTAAELDGENDLDLPSHEYFSSLRSMLRALNRAKLLKHLENSEDFVLGIDESPRRIGASNVIGVTLTNEDGVAYLIHIAEHNERTDQPKSTLDADLVISMLEEEFGDKFETVCRMIHSVLTDNSQNAKATRQKVCQKLDELFEIDSPRQALPCNGHVANIGAEDLMKWASPTQRLHSLSRKCGSTIARPSTQAKDNIYVHWHEVVPNKNFQYKHGKRFFHMLDNILLAFLEFSNLKEIVETTSAVSIGAKEIHEMLSDDSIREEMAIVAAMKPILDYFWSDFATEQTGIDFQIKVRDMQLAYSQIESSELDVLEYLETFHHSQDALDAQIKIFDDFFDNDNFCEKLRCVFLRVTAKVLKHMEPYVETDEPTHLLIPHNISVEG